MQLFDLPTALELTTRIAAGGQALSTLELLWMRHHFDHQGIFSLGAVSPFHRRQGALRVVDRYLKVLLGLQLAASVALVLLGPFSSAGHLLLAFVFLAAMTIRWRRHVGGDGAEQISAIVFAAVGLAVLPWPAIDRMAAAATFIAAQVSLSYWTAGIAKIISPAWRDGSALPAILSTDGHGHPLAARLLSQHSNVARFLSWSVIVFECLFPLLIFGPSWLVVPTLICGFAFHVGCAVLMGLNSFLWSFPATYPCVIAAAAYWKMLT